ncbi:transcriptional regulator YetL [Bacillus inaquosorum]|uniref:MarR family transcriptional regulator n=2 Tax=Bacillus inaquosorum TaxID=483913 RepID=A0A9W5PC94_9BACI|nr:transcriptional regulator YetL [Bacillus inaquosorum]RKQ21549.1 MarR family transcriptional regulator [Bacillus subtilis]AWM16086.1 MarR family transcriptional regulator [Bacillus inaquosorum]ELS60543.1 MarR family transcriptional regulator [Bacillus inaquosorum KCTC 13429]MCY7758750.1 transcriptional regulator YetL [Bacillus inaquosorum]MCY7905331.1 transcriptional regulator YetL [Bacillus inaquosorum]
MELKHLPKYKHITEHAETYANIDAGSLELFLSLFDISKKMNHVMEHYFAGRGLSEGKFKILMLLFDAKDHTLSPTELAKQSNVTKATITGLLDGLARDGFVSRRHHTEDKRKISIELTKEGKERLEQFLPGHFGKISAVMENYSDEEKDMFVKMLGDLFERLSVFKD